MSPTRTLFLAVGVALAGLAPAAVARAGVKPPASAHGVPAPTAPAQRDLGTGLVLDLHPNGTVVRARAASVPVGAVLRRLREALALTIEASPAIEARRVALDLKDRPLEELLLELAPAVVVDYRHVADADPRRLAVHLRGEAEAPPEPRAVGGFLIEGHTDGSSDESTDGSTDGNQDGRAESGQPVSTASASPRSEGPLLEVKVEAGRVALSFRQQGLGVVLFEVAQAYQVPFEMGAAEAPGLEQLDVVGVLPAELVALLGRGAGVDVRRDARTGEERPLRFFLTAAGGF